MTKLAVAAAAALSIVLLCAAPSVGQGSDGLRLGVRAGAAWNSISYDSPWVTQDTDLELGFSGGLVLELPLDGSGNLAARSGIAFVIRGGEVDGGTITDEHGTPVGTLTIDWTYAYVVVPLNVKYSFGTGQVSPYVAGGAEIGMPVRAETESRISPPPVFGGGGSQDVRDDMRALEVALMAAGGLEFPLGLLVGFVEVAYVYGMTDVWKSDLEELSNRTLTLSGGFMY